jgi:hypothetical protein
MSSPEHSRYWHRPEIAMDRLRAKTANSTCQNVSRIAIARLRFDEPGRQVVYWHKWTQGERNWTYLSRFITTFASLK